MAFPVNFYKITVATTALNAINDTAAVLQALLATGGRWSMLVTTETGGIRWKYDGNDPTTTEGQLLAAGSSMTISGGDLIRRFKMIRDGSTSATVTIQLKGEQL